LSKRSLATVHIIWFLLYDTLGKTADTLGKSEWGRLTGKELEEAFGKGGQVVYLDWGSST